MGSTQGRGMGQGPALQVGSKISSWSATVEETTLSWGNQEGRKTSPAWQQGPFVLRVRNVVSDHYSVCNSALCNHDQASYRNCLFQENKSYGSKNQFAVQGRDVRSGDTYNPDSTYKQKTVIAATNFASKFFLTGPLPIAMHFSQRSYHCQSASVKSATALFLPPPPNHSRRPPGWGWGQAAVKTMSKMAKKQRQKSL